MTSSMLLGDRRLASSSRRGPMTVLGKVPKPVNLPSQRLENHGRDPNVEIVPKGTLGWGSRSSSASNAWGSPSLSPKADGGTSPSHLSGHLSSGSGTRPSTAGSEKAHEPSSNAWGPNSRPSSASGALTSNQTSLTSLRPRSAETRPGSSQLSRFAEHSEHPVAWSAPGTAEKLGVSSAKNDGFSLSSGDFPTLGSEKDNPGNNAKSQDHSSYCRPGSSSGDRVAKETTGTSLVGDVSANANVKSGTANSWKRENPSYSGDGGRPGMEKWQGNPHPYPSANVPPQHYDGWHGGPVTNPQGGVWYRGPPGATPYGTPVPPGGFPMEPFPYYPPQIPPAALANAQPVPPPGAGPRGHHPKNGDMYRGHMQDAYIRPGMPIRPGFYPGPVPYEGYYPSPMGYCNPNERDVPFVGMAAGPPVYNRYPSQSAPEPGNSHGRPSGYGPTNQVVMSEQLESGHPHEARAPYKVLLKQHDSWDRRNEEQRNESAVLSHASCLEREDQPRTLASENDWRSDHRKGGERDQRKAIGEETASQNFDNRGACSVPMKVAPESLGNIKAADVISVKKLGTEASGTPEIGQPLLAAAKDSSLIQKIEGLNAKARVSDGRNDTASVSSREEQKNRFQVNAKANHSVNERGSSFVNPERSHATEIVNPSHEVGFSAGDKNQVTAGSGISISRRSNQGVQSRSDHRGRGRLNNQEGEGWWKKSLVSEPTTVVSSAHLETPNVHLQDHLATMEATEKSGSYPQGRHEEESATPLLDPNDSEAQRAKMRELAKQRTKQLQEEEEERTRRQVAKALAKLEELNRRTQVVEGSNENFAKLEELNRSTPVVEGSNEKYEEEEERTRGQTAKCFHVRPKRHVVSQQSRVSTFENCCSMDHIDLAKSGCKYAGAFDDSALISVIGQKMSHHFDNLLHAVEALSAQLSQLETRLHRLENSVDDLKDSTEINHGRNDGKLRQLENILREVEGGMHDLRDKQEISEAKLQLATLQMLKGHQQLENQGSNVQTISTQGVLSSAPQQSHQPHSTPVACLQLSSFPPNVPPTQPHQNLPQAPAAQVHTHSPQNQIPSVQQTDSNYSPPVLNPQPAPQIYYMPQVQQSQPPPTAPYQYYPPAPHLSPTSLLQRLPQLHPPLNAVDPQTQSSLVHNPGETPYMLSQRYPPSMQKPSNATGMALPTQQQYMGSFQYTHDQSTRNHCSDLSAGHMQPVQHSTFDDFYSHEGSPSHNSGSKTKHSQILPASLDCSGGSSISRLPTAQVLPYAIPMASSVDKESSSGVTGNRVPIDNVIDEVVAMGFRRDIVRATAKKMTENGQSVDINVVLDKLMNNGEVQPKSGGFGR